MNLWIVYPGTEGYDLDERISVLPVSDLPRIGLRLESPRSTSEVLERQGEIAPR